MRPLWGILALGSCVGRQGPSASTLDRGTDTAWTKDAEESFEPLEPSVRILGSEEGIVGHGLAAIPAFGPDPAVLIIGLRSTGDLAYNAVLLHEPIERGVYTLEEVWDGVSSTTAGAYAEWLHPAGDVNADGHLDVWYGSRLFTGPFVGRLWTEEEPYALQDGFGDGRAVASFDADRDGTLDVVFMRGRQRAYLHYGPFQPGLMPSHHRGDAAPQTVTILGDSGCPGNKIAWRMRDHLGPGHDALAVGTAGDCGGPDTFFYDVAVPRGTVLGHQDAFAWAADFHPWFPSHLDDPGDLDGDGHPDVIWAGNSWSNNVPAGPVQGEISNPHVAPPLALQQNPLDSVEHAIGDLNGDGVQELLGILRRPKEDRYAYVVYFSPFDEPLNAERQLNLGTNLHESFGEVHEDLDGDNLPDLVGSQQVSLEGGGEIVIFYGADLLAAAERLNLLE